MINKKITFCALARILNQLARGERRDCCDALGAAVRLVGVGEVSNQ